MGDWELEANDLYAGVMFVDLALSSFRLALSRDFNTYLPVLHREQLTSLRGLATS